MLKNCVFRADVDPPVDPRSRQESRQDHGADICRHHRIGSSHGRGQLAYGSQRIRAVWYPVGGNVHRRASGAASQDLRGGDPTSPGPARVRAGATTITSF